MELDERFSKVAKDPRFQRMEKKERKVKIDSRFKGMFTDKKFHSKYNVDKRGKLVKESTTEDLHKFYELASEEEEDDEGSPNKSHDTGIHMQRDKSVRDKAVLKEKQKKKPDSTSTEKRKSKKVNPKKKSSKKAVQLADVSSSSDEDEELTTSSRFDDIRGQAFGNDDDTASESEDDSPEIDLEEGLVHGWGELDEDARRIENAETSRLAICNCDWDKITATDLFVLCNSFKPAGGVIRSVKVYPSDFGLSRMKEEDMSGPAELKDIALNDDDSGLDDDTIETSEGSTYHMEKLRQYQLNRLKYYYAIVECDSKETADKIYEECDGFEYELSATRLDLRFVPDDTTFDHEPKSIATEMPSVKSYEPAVFLNTALQQSTVRLTWDESDARRVQATNKQFSQEDIEQMDFKDYLASSSGEEEDEEEDEDETEITEKNGSADNKDGEPLDAEEERIKKYRALMDEIESKEKAENEDDDDGMEITWEPGMSLLGEKILKEKEEKEDAQSLTPWEKMMKKKKEKKDEKKKNRGIDTATKDGKDKGEKSQDEKGEESEVDGSIDGDDPGFDDPFFENAEGKIESDTEDKKDTTLKTKKKKKKKKTIQSEENMTEEQIREKNQLELLLMDEAEDKNHFNMKAIMEGEKTSKKKKRKKLKDTSATQDNFEVDVNDARFSAIYTTHAYAIDPSEPHFKKTKATEAIMKETLKRRELQQSIDDSPQSKKKGSLDPSLSSLIKSVKAKSQSHHKSKKKSKVS